MGGGSPARGAAGRTSSSRPTDGELVLRVHLMSAGRLRYLAPGAKGPKTPMFRLRFADGGELVLTEAGKKKRAGVWLVTPGAARRRPRPPRAGRARARRRAARARSWAASAASSTRCSATSARSPASGARTRTRSCCARGSRRSRRRRSSPPRRSSGSPPRSTTTSTARSSCASGARATRTSTSSTTGSASRARSAARRSRASTSRSTRSTTARAARPAVRHAQGPPALATPALSDRTLATRGRRGLIGAKLEDDLQASSPEIALALSRAGVTGRAEGGADPPRRRRDGHGRRHRLHRRPRRRPEGRPHVALPGALRGGDRLVVERRGAARRGARRAHRAAASSSARARSAPRCGSARSGRSTAARRSPGSRRRRW